MIMSTPDEKIAFIDLEAQRRYLGEKIDQAITRVLDHGRFIMGPEVMELEAKLSVFTNTEHCVTCSSGTDALALPLMAWGIGPGDAVFVPSFSFCATAEVVPWLGATPVFVDVQEKSFNIDPDDLNRAIEQIKTDGTLTPKVVIAVDLFGQMADYSRIKNIATTHDLKLIADSAQAFGATLKGCQPCIWADVMSTSFFPAKPFGCYGDGGAVLTNDGNLAETMRSLRVHGQGSDKYDNVRIGMNGRLDTLQAAILIEKLSIFSEEIEKRNTVAERYNAGLQGVAKIPELIEGAGSVWAQYTLITEKRDEMIAALKDRKVPTAVYYPKPLHQQTAYRSYPISGNGLPVSERLSREVVSLPMHPYLKQDTQDYIVSSICDAAKTLGLKAPGQDLR